MDRFTHTYIYNFSIDDELTMWNIDIPYRYWWENDGIGPYEFWGQKCFDDGRDYLAIERDWELPCVFRIYLGRDENNKERFRPATEKEIKVMKAYIDAHCEDADITKKVEDEILQGL